MDGKRLLFLCIVLVAYICIGAGLFMAVEHWRELQVRRELKELYDDFLGNYTCVNETVLRYLISRLDNAKGEGIFLVDETYGNYMFDFASALCFSITVITTIGYGDAVPVTTLGRCITVAYALIGIPLCLIVLGGVGERMSKVSRRISMARVSRYATVNKAMMTIVLIVIGVGFLFILPAAVLMAVEGWPFFIGLYFSVITLTTVGFGDFVPGEGEWPPDGHKRNLYKIGVYVWILMGLAYLSLVIQILVHVISRRAEQVRKKAAEKVVDFKKVSVKFTKRISRAELNSPTIDDDAHGIVNPTLSLESEDELAYGSQYEDLCEKCRQIVIAMENNVKLVRVSRRKEATQPGQENGEVVMIADERL